MKKQYKFICVLDFEATCNNVPRNQFPIQEIIEFPSVLLAYTSEDTLLKIDEFQQYVKPVFVPKLTPFCTELTGITQEQVDKGVIFTEALESHRKWLYSKLNEEPTQDNVLIVTCGDWDCANMLPRQCQLSKVKVPSYFKKWCNIKTLFTKFTTLKTKGMTDMLRYFKLKLLGRHHSGIDDCKNISRVVMALAAKDCYFAPTGALNEKNEEEQLPFNPKVNACSFALMTPLTTQSLGTTSAFPILIRGPTEDKQSKPLPKGYIMINTTSRSQEEWSLGLSPFFLGPCKLYGNYEAQNMENAWQFCKVYKEHADAKGNPTDEYWKFAIEGWKDKKAHRFPMGRGAKPLYSLWDNKKLGYIEARKQIYAPLYAEAVQKTKAYQQLQQLYVKYEGKICLWDFDGYDYVDAQMSFTDVMNDEKKKMGHSFVLAMLLTNNKVWEQ